MNLHQLGEFGLIERLSAQLQTRAGVLLGIGDDAAVLSSLQTPVVTCDCLVEGVHFRRDWTTPFLLGRKTLSVNLSDCAAMGARPVAAFLALTIGEGVDFAWLDELYRGMESVCEEFNFSLAGGDTSRGAQTTLSVTLIGEALGEPVLRSSAQIGDVLLVTGTLGDSAAGLQFLFNDAPFFDDAPSTQISPEVRARLLSRHFDPTPRLREIEAARNAAPNAVHAALDLSDGIAGDARHIANRSHVSLQIDVNALPISNEAQVAARELGAPSLSLDWALSGGEDYELLLCVAPEAAEIVAQTITAATRTLVTAVGRVVPREGDPVVLLRADGSRTAARGAFEHF